MRAQPERHKDCAHLGPAAGFLPTLCFAGDGDLDDAAGLEGVDGVALPLAILQERWCSLILSFHQVSTKGFFHGRPVQSAAAVWL